jgi:hypothetical protein
MIVGSLASTAIAIAELATEDATLLVTALLVGPLIAAVGATDRQTAAVAVYATALTVPCSIATGIWGTEEQLIRTSIVLLSSLGAIGLAHLRQLRDEELARTRPQALDALRLRLALDAGDMGTWSWDL